MSASKCCYIIFSGGNENRESIFEFRLNDEFIPYDKNPVFLGITFDERMCFNAQIDKMKKKCFNRLNIIKIISHKSWRLSKKTLVATFYALTRSVLDYFCFGQHVVSNTNMLVLQRIQNRAISIIFKPPPSTNLQNLASVKGIMCIENRLKDLFENYIFKGMMYRNPVTDILIEEYVAGFRARPGLLRTPLCAVRGVVLNNEI